MCGETPPGRPARSTEPVEPVAQAADAERAAEVVQEDLDRRRAPSSPRSARTGRPSVEVGLERVPRGTAEQADPLLAALAHDPDLAAPKVERGQVRRGQLADPQARGIRGLDQRPVPQRERDAECGAVRVVTGRSAEVLVDDREQPVDLLDLEDSREAARLSRRGDGAPRVARGQPGPGRPAMERADGRQSLGDG